MTVPAIKERDFEDRVIAEAHLRGWIVAHFRPGMNQRGRWTTPVKADGAGFPDLVMARPPRVIFAELKREKGRTSDYQKIWLETLWQCNVECYLWRPSDADTISRVLA